MSTPTGLSLEKVVFHIPNMNTIECFCFQALKKMPLKQRQTANKGMLLGQDVVDLAHSGLLKIIPKG